MRLAGRSVAAVAARILLAVVVAHGGIAAAATVDQGTAPAGAMSAPHDGHAGHVGADGDAGGSGGASDCCDDPGCDCGCAAPMACLMTTAYAGGAPALQAAAAAFHDREPAPAGIATPFRPPA